MPPRITVLTLVDGLGSGGAETLAARVATRLDRTRFDSWVCVTRPTAPAAVAEVEAAGARVLVLSRGSRFAVWGWLPLVRLLRRERVDVLHAHKIGSNLWGTVLGRLARVPLIVAHEHGSEAAPRRLRRLADRYVVGRADLVLAVSEVDRRRLVALGGIREDKVRVVPNGIPPVVASGRDVRAELDIAAGAPVVMSVAVVRPEKALGNLVRAAAVLAPELPALRVLVAGTGPAEEIRRLEGLVGELGLEDVVTLLGTRSDVPDLLAAADVAVICSDREGQPLALMEYMAAGNAIVATHVGGIPELVDDRVHGLLVQPGNVEALAGAIRELVNDPILRDELGRNARARQRADLDLDVMVRRIEALYVDAETARAPAGG